MIKMDFKGQSGIEFIILVGAVFFFFLAFLLVLQNNIADQTFENRDIITREIALTVQNEVALATGSVDGYYREFNLPTNILGSEYHATIVENFVFVNSTDGRHGLALTVANVTGEINIGANVIIRKGGEVILNG
jgi:hypothetical protein